jgi:catechol 2,3-dioxygenase-like lactoylglutathione lyase family enzyme
MFDGSTPFSSFAVPDTEAARAFYGDTLGLDVRDSREAGLLELHLGDGPPVLVYPKPDHAPANFTILNFAVPDIDAAVDGLIAAGVRMERYPDFEQNEKGIARGPQGPAIAWFKDPAGNIIAVLEDGG